MESKAFKIFKDYTDLFESERLELKQIIEHYESKIIFLRKIFVDQLEENIAPSEEINSEVMDKH